MIPFGEWLPDLGSHGNPGALAAINVIPAADDGYIPLPSQQPIASPLAGYARGAATAQSDDGNSYVYAGDEAKLYRYVAGGWSDATRTVGGAYTSGPVDRWELQEWGENMIATNFADNVQIMPFGGANFADLGGNPPRAKHVARLRDFVILGNLPTGVRKLAWCGFGDETAWAPSAATQAGEQEFTFGGDIEAIVGGEVATIFQRYAIRRMTYVGPPEKFRFDVVDNKSGALCSGGVIDAGPVTYYLGLDGFYSLSPQGKTNISSQKVSELFFKDLDRGALHRVSGAFDITRSIAVWAYPGAQSGGIPNKLFIYHWPTGRWTCGEVGADALFPYLSPGYTLEDLDGLSATLEGLMASLDSAVYQGGQFSFGGFKTDGTLAPFEGSPLKASIETKELGGMQRTLVQGFRPYIMGGDVSVTHYYRDNLNDGYDSVGPIPVNVHGIADFLRDSRFHRFRVDIENGFDNAKGGEALTKAGGMF